MNLKVGFEIEGGVNLTDGADLYDFELDLADAGMVLTRDAHHYEGYDVPDMEAITRGEGSEFYRSELETFIDVMNKYEYISEPQRTGLHINVSPADGFFSDKMASKIITTYIMLEETLYNILPSGRRTNRYSGYDCDSHINRMKEKIESLSIHQLDAGQILKVIKEARNDYSIKYCGLGLHHMFYEDDSKKRLEFRLFDSRLNNLEFNLKIVENLIQFCENHTIYQVLKKCEKVRNYKISIHSLLHL